MTEHQGRDSLGTDVDMTWTIKESIARPTAKDYKVTRRLLSDFCIVLTGKEIPEFRHMFELVKWRTRIITAYLDGLAI